MDTRLHCRDLELKVLCSEELRRRTELDSSSSGGEECRHQLACGGDLAVGGLGRSLRPFGLNFNPPSPLLSSPPSNLAFAMVTYGRLGELFALAARDVTTVTMGANTFA
ncbi:hypothetical protein SRHO_G00335580 [Serrasalmus rhombeus]